jgi:IstB-like ATP binding protein
MHHERSPEIWHRNNLSGFLPRSTKTLFCHEGTKTRRHEDTKNSACVAEEDRDEHVKAATVDDWGKLLGDTAAVTALLDRLLHHAHVLKCGPRSWRTKAQPDLRTDGRSK